MDAWLKEEAEAMQVVSASCSRAGADASGPSGGKGKAEALPLVLCDETKRKA